MKIYLLTHERELERPSNTGRLALETGSAPEAMVERIVWSRVAPSEKLLSVLKLPLTGLLYPVSEVAGVEYPLEACENFVLLDATWQEARKMFNRSVYLQDVARVSLLGSRASSYALRRNQKPGGLCTAECVVEILRRKGREAMASDLEARFAQFNSPP